MRQLPLLAIAFILLMSACSESYRSNPKNVEWKDIEKDLQTQFILIEDGGTITIPEGYYKFKGSLTMDAKKSVTIVGAGQEKTILSFEGQTDGAEGFLITNSESIEIKDLTIQDTKGDCIKTRKVNGISFINVTTEWLGEPKETNGSYGFYPVDCDDVLLDGCIAIGASDAGIYVGQSRGVIVKNCTAKHNVAGIEIENCIDADVFDNYSTANTGGVLVFDMPNLTQSGRGVRVFNNEIVANNYTNFAPEGNIVGEVPPGTGVMILATDDVEIFDNEIRNNKTLGVAITSYKLVEKPFDDPTFDPYPKGIYVYGNTFSRPFYQLPTFEREFGKLLLLKFPFKRPDIIYDGFLDPTAVDESTGKYKPEFNICIGDNNGAKFVNIDAENDMEGLTTDRAEFDCERTKLKPVTLGLN